MSKVTEIKSKVEEAEEFARKVWLAGLGAYGKSWDVLTGKFDQAYEESNKVVNELIADGEKVQADLQQKLDENIHLEEKVNQLKEKLGINKNSEDKLAELNAKLDSLTVAVAALAEKKATEQAAPVAEKKPATRRKSTASKSTTATKTAAKKPATTRARKAAE